MLGKFALDAPKIGIFNANVKAVLLYWAKLWEYHSDHNLKRMEDTDKGRQRRRILVVWWPETISNEQF